MTTHRNQRPRIYNRMRQFEHPLPNLELAADDNERSNISSQQTNNLDEVEIQLTDIVGINSVDSVGAAEMDPLNDSETDIKPDPLSLFEGNRGLIEHFLTGTCELDESDSFEEVIFSNDCTDFPMPMKCDMHDLVKRENDEMSGNISYNEKVIFHFYVQIDPSLNLPLFYILLLKDGDRIYRVGENLIQIPARVISQIIEWNRNRRDEIALDMKIFGSLLLCLVNPENLKEGLVNDCIMDFIQSIFFIHFKQASHSLILRIVYFQFALKFAVLMQLNVSTPSKPTKRMC